MIICSNYLTARCVQSYFFVINVIHNKNNYAEYNNTQHYVDLS